MRVLFAAGGTGGHLFPALAVAQELMRREPESKVLFAGTHKGLEASLVPKAGFEITFISIFGLRRKIALSNVVLPLILMKSLVESFLILRRFSPHLVFGTGGYVSGPVLLAAILRGIPTMLHEQNSRPGLTTRCLARWVSLVLPSFSPSEIFFRRKNNLLITGNPTRCDSQTQDGRAARRHFGLGADLETVLIFGGSLGAHSINMAVLDSIQELLTNGAVQILWQTGKSDFECIRSRTAQHGDRIKVLPFIEDMIDAYLAADVVLCRAGATTLAEITRIGIPALLVPYPHAIRAHQELNASLLVEAGAANMILDHELCGRRLATAIHDLLRDPNKRKGMEKRSRSLGHPEAAVTIVEAMLGFSKHRSHNDT